MDLTSTAPPADQNVFLTGRPPLAEFLDFVTGHTVGGQEHDPTELADRWRKANDHIRDLEVREAGWADSPTVGDLPPELLGLRDSVLADPIYRRSFTIVPTAIAMVELDRLVVFQKRINLSYVARLQQALGDKPSLETIFKSCLPFEHPQPTVRAGQIAQNAFVFVSPSADLRVLDVTQLSAAQLTNYPTPQGPVSGVVALVVGFGSNFLNVIHAENRLVLNNGSHRAYALRELGITHVPAILQRVSRRDELEVLSSGDLSTRPDAYLRDARPPLMKDYFDPALRSTLPVPRRNRQVKVTFRVEALDVPAT